MQLPRLTVGTHLSMHACPPRLLRRTGITRIVCLFTWLYLHCSFYLSNGNKKTSMANLHYHTWQYFLLLVIVIIMKPNIRSKCLILSLTFSYIYPLCNQGNCVFAGWLHYARIKSFECHQQSYLKIKDDTSWFPVTLFLCHMNGTNNVL